MGRKPIDSRGMRMAGSGPLENRGAVIRESRRRASPWRNWTDARFLAGTDMAECAYLYSYTARGTTVSQMKACRQWPLCCVEQNDGSCLSMLQRHSRAPEA